MHKGDKVKVINRRSKHHGLFGVFVKMKTEDAAKVSLEVPIGKLGRRFKHKHYMIPIGDLQKI